MNTITSPRVRIGDTVESLMTSAPGTGTVVGIAPREDDSSEIFFIDPHPGSEIPPVTNGCSIAPVGYGITESMDLDPMEIEPLYLLTGSTYGDRETKMYSLIDPDGVLRDFESCISAAKFVQAGTMVMHLGYGVTIVCDRCVSPWELSQFCMDAFEAGPRCLETVRKLKAKL